MIWGIDPGVPGWCLIAFLIIFFVGVITIFGYKKTSFFNWLRWLLLTEYLFFTLCSTVIFRPINDFHRTNRTVSFWFDTDVVSLVDCREPILNILLFIPIGLILGFIVRNAKLASVVLWSIIISLSIEILQYYLYKGTASIDDVVNNTIGSVLGGTVSILILTLFTYRKN